jgi:Family of unknown function (DUF6510)
MDEASRRLDGNACAGLLAEIFTTDVTASRCACAGCGVVVEIGAHHLYDHPGGPGAVLRCRDCERVLLVVVDTGGRYRIAVQGMTWLEVDRPA